MSGRTLELPKDFCGEVRLFPLSNLVLFPGNLLPLHIFESRYQEMLEDAVGGDELITMATLLPGFEHDYYSRPPISPYVCIGRVISHERTDRGTYNLILAGLHRARVEHEIEPVRSFRRAQVCLIKDRQGEGDRVPETRGLELVKVLRTVFSSSPEFLAVLEEPNLTLGQLTDLAAFFLPLPSDLKLQLLAEPDPGVRSVLLQGAVSKSVRSRQGKSLREIDFSDN